MIPPPDVPLTSEQRARWQFTKLAAALVASGVSVDLVMSDAREGCNLASTGEKPRTLTLVRHEPDPERGA